MQDSEAEAVACPSGCSEGLGPLPCGAATGRCMRKRREGEREEDEDMM